MLQKWDFAGYNCELECHLELGDPPFNGWQLIITYVCRDEVKKREREGIFDEQLEEGQSEAPKTLCTVGYEPDIPIV